MGDLGILGALSSGLGLGPIHSHEETEGHCLWERKPPGNSEGVKESQVHYALVWICEFSFYVLDVEA